MSFAVCNFTSKSDISDSNTGSIFIFGFYLLIYFVQFCIIFENIKAQGYMIRVI